MGWKKEKKNTKNIEVIVFFSNFIPQTYRIELTKRSSYLEVR